MLMRSSLALISLSRACRYFAAGLLDSLESDLHSLQLRLNTSCSAVFKRFVLGLDGDAFPSFDLIGRTEPSRKFVEGVMSFTTRYAKPGSPQAFCETVSNV